MHGQKDNAGYETSISFFRELLAAHPRHLTLHVITAADPAIVTDEMMTSLSKERRVTVIRKGEFGDEFEKRYVEYVIETLRGEFQERGQWKKAPRLR